MCHFGGFASEGFLFFFFCFCFGGWDVDLGDDVDERLGCAGEESVSDFVAVGPGTLWISKRRRRRRVRWRWGELTNAALHEFPCDYEVRESALR